MADPATISDATSGLISGVSSFIAAAGALGTAAYGLVDASKAFGGGVSRVGFKSIKAAIDRLLGRTGGPGGGFGTADVLATLHANWLNGVAKADQKATAKSLVRLALTPANAPGIAWAVGLNAGDLARIAESVQNGTALTQDDLNVLGRFDATVSAILDEAYEHADQQYRNWAKVWACVVGVVLAAIGGAILFRKNAPFDASYFKSQQFLISILVGAISAPLAPIAKDVSTAIAAGVAAVAAWKR